MWQIGISTSVVLFLWLFFPWIDENSRLAEWGSQARACRGMEQGYGARSGNASALIATRRHFPYFYWMCLMSCSELSSSCSGIQEGEKKWFVCSAPLVVHIHGLALSPAASAQFRASYLQPLASEVGLVVCPSPSPENPKLPACSNSWCTLWAQGPAVLWQQFNKHGWSTQMGVARNAACVCASSCNGVEKSKEDKAIRLLFQMS